MNKENRVTNWSIKIMMAAGSVALALVIMGLSTYAWFSVSTAPEVKEVKVQMETTKNFEIAKRTSDAQPAATGTNDESVGDSTWGETVTFTSVSASALKYPCIAKDTGLYTVTYNSTSKRTNGLVQLNVSNTNSNDGLDYYKTSDGAICAVVYKIWLRTNTTGNVTATIESQSTNDNLRIMMKIGDAYKTAGTDGTGKTVDCGQFTASDQGTACEIIAYMYGGAESTSGSAVTTSGSGIRAIDVGEGSTNSAITFSVKFKNDKVNSTTGGAILNNGIKLSKRDN